MAFRLLFTAIFILLISAGASHAEPVSAIVTAIGAAIKASLTAAALVKAALAIAVNVGMGLIKQAQAKKAQRKQEPRGTTLSVQFGDTRPLSYIIGTKATAGRRYYAGTWGSAGKTPNAFATDCRVISDLPSYNGPQGLQEAWFGPTKGTILWDQPHPLGWGFPVLEFRSGGTDYLWVKYYDGTQTAADPFLLATFGAVSNHPYLPTMIGHGCQLAIYTCRVNEVFFPQGFPDALFVPKPMKLYDLRFDSTAGGFGPQRWGDVSTYASSDLLPVMMYNVARGMYYDGKWVHGGRNFASHRLPASSWMAAINEADRAMEEGRKQFRGGLEVFVDEESLDTLEDMRVGCAGRLAEVGGALKLSVGSPAGAVYSFTDVNVVVTSDQGYEPFPSVKSTHNTITSDYPEPKERWKYKDAPEKISAELLARDGGQKLPVAVRFEAVPFSAQVQSLMTAMIAEEQRWRVHDLVLPPSAIGLEPNDVLSWTSEKQGYSAKRMIAARVTRLTGSSVRVMMKEIDPNDYNPPEIIIPPVIGWTGPIVAPPQPMNGWTAVPDYVPDATGSARRPGIRIGCAPDQDDVQKVRVWVRVKATGAIVFDSDATPYASPHSWLLSGSWCLPNALYQACGQFLPYSRRPTEPSAWIDVLTPDVRLTPADIRMELISKAVRDDLAALDEWIWRDTSIRSLIDDRKALARSLAEQDLANFADKQGLRRELTSRTGDLSASFAEQITIATSATAALAAKVDLVSTSLGDKVNSSVFNSLASQVSSIGSTVTAQGDAITSINVSLAGKASLTAFNILSGTVTSQGDTLASQGTLISSLSAQVGDVSADGRMRFEVYNTGISGYSKAGFQTRFGTADNFRTAGLFAYTPSDPNQQPRVVVTAGRFAVAANDDELGSQIFAVDAQGVYMNTAYIRSISTDKIIFGDGSIQSSAIAAGAVVVMRSESLPSANFAGSREVYVDLPHGNRAALPNLRVKVEGFACFYTIYDGGGGATDPLPCRFQLINVNDNVVLVDFSVTPPRTNVRVPIAYAKDFPAPLGRTDTRFVLRLTSTGTAVDMTIIASAFKT